MKNIPLTISIITLTIALILSVSLYVLYSEFQDFKKDQFIYSAESSYAQSKLEFCIDNSVAPCEDATISEFNESTNTQKFEFKSYEDIVEDGITQFELSQK